MKSLWMAVTRLVLPADCSVCGEALERASETFHLCTGCAPWCEPVSVHPSLYASGPAENRSSPRCRFCGEQLPVLPDRVCLFCRITGLDVPLHSLFYYDRRTERLVKSLKYRGRYELIQPVATYMAEAVQGLQPRAVFTRIVAVPSSRDRVAHRGYAHMVLLAREMARILKLPFSHRALLPIRRVAPQASIALEKRRGNIHRVFHADPKLVSNGSILLIDDVLTTGATIQEAVRALRDAGAVVESVLTLARSERFQTARLAPLRNLTRKPKRTDAQSETTDP